MDCPHIRNFCIIAHIDHGKSTLADRFIEKCHALSKREMRDQVLDDMDLERERGITIKARAVALKYEFQGETYLLNLIDTPGHVDFTYEVSRSLAACEGAILLVDAGQGVEAQSVANAYLALEANLEILPALNKIDLPTARPDEVIAEMNHILGIRAEEVGRVSAKTGAGVDELLQEVIRRVPHPQGNPEAPLQALIFDAHYDEYQGVIVYVRLHNGRLRRGDMIRMIGKGRIYEVGEVGRFMPNMVQDKELSAGEVGYITANIKELQDVSIGDTITGSREEGVIALPGYREAKPMVFCALYPTNYADYDALKKALLKLRLNDSSFTFEPDSSEALGFGFRCGFMGLLHMEIIQERLERESGLDLVQTAPNVTYELRLSDGTIKRIENPREIPDENLIEEWREPFVTINLLIPSESIGPMMKICQDRRGVYKKTEYISPARLILTYEMPLSEIIFDFYDKLKSVTRGYGTMDYEFSDFRGSDLVKMKILVAGAEVDALSTVCHREAAPYRGRLLIKRLKKTIPRHLFVVALQAAIGGKVIARENISAMSKNVLAKCYGGDVTRKRKLLEKQKEGKKRMKQVGAVEIPQEAFLSILKLSDEEED